MSAVQQEREAEEEKERAIRRAEELREANLAELRAELVAINEPQAPPPSAPASSAAVRAAYCLSLRLPMHGLNV